MKHYKIVLISLTSVLLLPVSNGQNESTLLGKYIDKKCDSVTATKLKEDISIFTSLLDRAFGYIPDNMQYFCGQEKEYLMREIKGIKDRFAKCVHRMEGYLPNFIEQTFGGFLHFMCHNYAENVKSLFGEEGQLCMQQLRAPQAANDLDQCFGSILPPLSNAYITREELCKNIVAAHRCFGWIINNQCPGGKVLPTLNDRLFSDLKRGCKAPKSNSGPVLQSSISFLFVSMLYAYTTGQFLS